MFTVDAILKQHYPKVAAHPTLFKPAKFILKHLLHEKEIIEFGQQFPHLQGMDFVEQVLDYFDVSYSVRNSEKESIPSEGRVVIIANHPIGSLDALALLKLLSEVRQDVKVVANNLLTALQPLESLLLPVNNMVGVSSKTNLKAIYQHLNQEGAVLIFPSGEVSRLRPQGVRDTHWHAGFLNIAKHTSSAILPVYIDAKNSPLFYGASMLYKPLASSLLVKEMFKRTQSHLPIRIGELIPLDSFSQIQVSRQQCVKLFKKHLYRIGAGKKGIYQTQSPIALPEDRKALKEAIKQQCERLGDTVDGKQIYLYRHQSSSVIMREIGRLREVAFRAVGEGTNKRRDVDHYDKHYLQLILWDNDDLEIAGAYRIGLIPEIIAQHGLGGLYSSSLFDYSDEAQGYFNQGIELGRSFVQPRYWGKRSLDYLWFGIGAFLKRHPQYRYLIGPVSLSSAYPKAAQDLIVNFYQTYFSSKQNLARSRQPFHPSSELVEPFVGGDYKSEFTRLKHSLANMGVAVPTLYKQYCDTYEPGGVEFIGFNVDPDFNDCIDGLIMGDIEKMTAKKRQRYL